MIWKAIGKSETGTSHLAVDKGCEDALHFASITDDRGNEILVCCASDGAGSAKQAAFASAYIVKRGVELLSNLCLAESLSEAALYGVAETIYCELKNAANQSGEPIEEYAATMLACVLTPDRSVFMQIGDGAIVRKNDGGTYQVVWWPHSGEYHNTTAFLVDDENMANLHVMVTEESTHEVSILTDGLQMLALSTETRNAHAPFFEALFVPLRQANDEHKLSILGSKLGVWLNSESINSRTDDDKTLFLATRTEQ
ncbi:MAG: protein phosphatase 2C domain-containing protein [Taibaiella sp.]|nr:protein phosphatase 2C domain-containing protein [Taibaiella sp.]